MLNRLFCTNNASYVIASTNSIIEEEDAKTTRSHSEQSTPTTTAADASSSKFHSATNNNLDVSACVRMSTTLIEQASESLTLHDEDKVRAELQTTIQDTLDIVCSSTTAAAATQQQNTSSPPTYCSSSKVSAFLHHHSPQRTQKSQPIYSMSEDQPSDESIEVSNDGRIEQTKSSVSKTNEVDLMSSKSQSDELRTPKQLGGGAKKPMKTPGGLVIPSPFTHSGKGLFPSTFGTAVLPSASSFLSQSSNQSPLPRKQARKDTKTGHPVPIVYIPDMAATLTTMASSTTSETQPPPPTTTALSPLPDRIEQERQDSPVLVRITSSLEDLDTVPEVTTSKEFDDTTTAGGTEGGPLEECDYLPNRAVEKATSRRALSKSPIPNDKILNAATTSLDDLRIQFERKLSEQKDQIALSNRVAKMRLDEIERLESIMDGLKDRPSHTTEEVQRLKDRLQQLQQEKKKDIERTRQEVQLQFEQHHQDWLQKQSKYQSMEEELIQVKKLLAESETSVHPTITLVPSNEVHDELERLKVALSEANTALLQKDKDAQMMMVHNDEVVALQQQLTRCRQELARAVEESSLRSERMMTMMNPSLEVPMSTETERLQLRDENDRMKEELSKVTHQLAQKEKELLTLRKKSNAAETSSRSTTTSTTPSRYMSPRTTPVRSGSKVRSRTSSVSNETTKSAVKEREENLEMNEREKETLRRQIELLQTQAAEMSREHDRALMELRRANEAEIGRIKMEMESRLEHHMVMERELKESLSAASSNEREELLEQIEILQAEKKLDQLSGLRDVQKREELLQRILTLEQKEKELAEVHERAVEELRSKSTAEIQQLRNELQLQQKLRAEREKEIETSLAESHSFEKNQLGQKIEHLESQIESERSGAVLLQIKISNFEKDVQSLKQEHVRVLQEQKASTADEMQRLHQELNDRLALEEAMQITTNERDTLEEELQLLKVKYDQDTRKLTEKMEELKKMHGHEKTILTNELGGKITKLENELNENSRDIDQMANQKCDEFKAKYEAQIEILNKNHAEEVGRLRLEMHAVEEKYKVLVTESNIQFESFQKDTESKIEELKDTIRSNEERYAQDLALAQQSTDGKAIAEELEKLQAQHESQMKAAEATHNKHFEDLLAQLDLVEAEQSQTTAAKDKALSEKDAIVDALGSQLAEAQRKISEAQHNRAFDLNALEESRKSYQALEKLTQALRNEVRDLKEMQRKFAKEAEITKEKACEEAREEMIEKAEVQFQQANEHYVKLRKQYDESQERAKKFESELKLLRKKVEKLTKEKESTEIDLKAELAHLHAANAKIEAESAQKAKEYRREMERLIQNAKVFEAKAEEATSTSHSIQTTLATVVAEKQKLQQEYEEMKSVSEELMAIVESGERHEC